MNPQRLPSFTAYRSFRYSLNRQQNIKTADAMSVPKPRIKKNSALESTMMKTGGFEQNRMSKTVSVNNYNQTSKYLRTFYSLMDSQKKISQTQKQKWSIKPLKLSIQNFSQLQHSDFNLLQPFQRHFRCVQQATKAAQKQLLTLSSQTNLLLVQLACLRQTTHLQLQQTQASCLSHLTRLKRLLNQNMTAQHQVKLRFKQQLTTVHMQGQERAIGGMMGKCQWLQEEIFQCRPFQLTDNEEWEGEGQRVENKGMLC